jgi:hypothetical protein
MTHQACPDCDSVVVLAVPDRGNGKCRSCHGIGTAHDLGSTFTGQRSPCSHCKGSTKCQTCGGSGTIPAKVKRPRAQTDTNPFDDKIAVRALCPGCGDVDWFEWKFLGKLTDQVCGCSWYVGSGTYTRQQLRAVIQSGGKMAKDLTRGVAGEESLVGGLVGKLIGGFGGVVIGIAFRLPFAIIMVPIQAIVRISVSKCGTQASAKSAVSGS